MELLAYLFITYYVARWLANKDGSDDPWPYMQTAFLWPAYPLYWLWRKVDRRK